MIYKSYDTYTREEGEPALRSCPECNPAHKHLMDAESLHTCFECGRYWIHGRYLDSFETPEQMDAFLKEKLKHGERQALPRAGRKGLMETPQATDAHPLGEAAGSALARANIPIGCDVRIEGATPAPEYHWYAQFRGWDGDKACVYNPKSGMQMMIPAAKILSYDPFFDEPEWPEPNVQDQPRAEKEQ